MNELILDALLPVVVTLALGALAGWHHDTAPEVAGAMNKMVMTYALPLSLFAGTVSTSRAVLLTNGPLLGFLALGMVVPFIVTLALAVGVFRRGLGAGTMQALAISFPAVPFIGLPVLETLFGASATIVVAMTGLVTNLVLVPVSIVLLSMQDGEAAGARPPGAGRGIGAGMVGRALGGTVREPVVWAPILAVVLVLCGVTVPRALVNSFWLLGHATAGVSLFASGVILQAQRPTLSIPVAVTLLGRLIVIPGVALVLFPLLGLAGKPLGETVISLGMPAAALILIFAVRYRVAEQENASVLLFTNVLAIPLLAILIALLRT